ncbi:hypothetical protein [Haploplasma axanthum]|uniref:Uncharacterized protein n=1 Tax=Haploplasma axanthum TaxID=29552 RepID=A0A449BBQ2_HAPAX|nr:hypothetical protein [Haploplasma axanthum]VEU79884.1 Uncharacterised protein [Haploplasma axanthum]
MDRRIFKSWIIVISVSILMFSALIMIYVLYLNSFQEKTSNEFFFDEESLLEGYTKIDINKGSAQQEKKITGQITDLIITKIEYEEQDVRIGDYVKRGDIIGRKNGKQIFSSVTGRVQSIDNDTINIIAYDSIHFKFDITNHQDFDTNFTDSYFAYIDNKIVFLILEKISYDISSNRIYKYFKLDFDKSDISNTYLFENTNCEIVIERIHYNSLYKIPSIISKIIGEDIGAKSFLFYNKTSKKMEIIKVDIVFISGEYIFFQSNLDLRDYFICVKF